MSVLMKMKLSVISYVLILMAASYALALKAMSLWKKLISVKVAYGNNFMAYTQAVCILNLIQTSMSVIKSMSVINNVEIQKVPSSVAVIQGLFLLRMERTVLVSTISSP